jgi:hypothetical protein
MVKYFCRPRFMGGWGRRITWAYEFKIGLGNTPGPCFKNKQIINYFEDTKVVFFQI